MLLIAPYASARLLSYVEYDFLPAENYTVAPENTTLHTLRVSYSSRTPGSAGVPVSSLGTGNVMRLRIFMPPGTDAITISGESGDWQGIAGSGGGFAEGTYPVMNGFADDLPFCSQNPTSATPTPCGAGQFIYPNQLEAATGGLNKKIFGGVVPNPITTPRYFYFIVYQQPNALGSFRFTSLSISMSIANISLYNQWWQNKNGGGSTPTNPTEPVPPTDNSVTLSVTEPANGTLRTVDSKIDCSAASKVCASQYVAGTTVTLNALANSGYQFAGWTGGCSNYGSANYILTILLQTSLTCGANFTQITTSEPTTPTEPTVPTTPQPPVVTDTYQSMLSVSPIELKLGDQTATPVTSAELSFYGNVVRNVSTETLALKRINLLESNDIVNLSVKIKPNPLHSLIDLVVVSSWGDSGDPMRKVFEKVDSQDFFGFSQTGWSQWESISSDRLKGLKAYKSALAIDNGRSFLVDLGNGLMQAPLGLAAKGRTVAFYAGYRYLDRLTGAIHLVVNEYPLIFQLPDAPVPTLLQVGVNTCAYSAKEGSCDYVRACRVEPEEFMTVNRVEFGPDMVTCQLYANQAGDATLYITDNKGNESSYKIRAEGELAPE
ncbi:InlB B-repeat-containing protein [Thioflexithrix psekupsensis]|uniref:InlB B-repeat-containing protein n=1 Tax=Thioflexithrix psekupsensis TaxID=1570016 RepID=UPI0011235E2E|nr:hypothetical protein [Thioflexithrix psekupsensis]